METKQDYRSSVFAWGSTAHGALGCPDPKVKAASTKKVQLVPKRLTECCTMRMNGGLPIRVVSGNGYSTILTDKREAYTLGNDGLGKGSERRKNVPGVLRTKSGSCNVKKVPVENVTNIAHGIGHSYALNLKGEIYCWGDVNLVLGTTKSANPTNPTKIDRGDSSKVTAVSCGEKHACVLLQNGMIMTMGANDAGQLGTGPIQHDHEHQEKGKVFHFIQHVRRGNNLLNSVRFKEISCGSYHSAAISSDGASLYTWGWGDAGRLGMGNEKMHNQPTCVESLSTLGPFAVVTCGTAQTLVATEGGDVYGFGWNAHGQISGAIKNDQAGASSDSCLLPVLCLKNKGVVKLSCSGFHSAAITLAGDLYMWGMNDDGQCGVGHELPITSPSRVSFPDSGTAQFAVSVSCGHSCTVCITSNYLPLEAEDLNTQLQKESIEAELVNRQRNAAQIIVRFARRLLWKKQAPVVQQIVDMNPPPDESSEEFQLDESSSLSSHSSTSDDDITMNARPQPQNEDGLVTAQPLNEDDRLSSDTQQANEVDHNFSVVVASVIPINQSDVQCEECGMEKEKAEAEPNKMRAEAVISRILHEQPKVKQSPKQKISAIPVRDDQIDKAAARLKLARERREQQAVAKKILPRVERSVMKKIHHERKEDITKKSLPDNANQKSDADLAHLEWNKKLLVRRESRLKTKEKVELEAAIVRERNARIEQERTRIVQQQARLVLEEQTRNAKNATRLRLSKESEELKRLEEKLNIPLTIPRGDENKENDSNFRDLKQWTKALSDA